MLVERTAPQFIGFQNYLDLARDEGFHTSTRATVYFTAVTVFIEVILGMFIAILLNEKFRGRGIVRGLILLPWAFPLVANSIMWKWILNSKYGALNGLLLQLGIIKEYALWLGDPLTALNVLVLADIWKETPFVVVLVLASLQSIPETMYESAKIDGANAFERFKNITFPLLKPILAIAAIIKTIWSIQIFDLVYIITRGGPGDSTRLWHYLAYINTFRLYKFGYGAAFSWVILIVSLILAVIYMRSLTIEY